MRRDRSLWLLVAGWAALAVASLWLRPLWPVDETRYASVAWDMWRRGDFLVPYINGEPYSHKPPLLFWLIHLGWAVTGVNEWWPRIVAPLCALAAMPLTLRLGALLWPEEDELGSSARTNAVWVLAGTLLFAGFVTLLMFDLLLLDCALISMIGVLQLTKEGGRAKGLLWLGAGIGLGVLAKGPVILLHVLPAAVVAPWWAPQIKGRLGRWYLDLLLGVLLGAAIALAWALPAAAFGGEAYRHAILWGQTAGRVSESFAHRAPAWYYLPFLPLILFPWFVWPGFWAGLKEIRNEMPSRFLLAWLLLTLIGFSLVSGKQAKYLVPFLPAFALLAGRALSRLATPGRPTRAWHLLFPVAGFLALPAFLLWLRTQPAALQLPEWAGEIPPWPAMLLALAALFLLFFCRKSVSTQMRALAFGTLVAAAIVVAGVIPAFVPYGDPGPAARRIAELQAGKVPVAHLGKYHAQYNFAGRLRAPIDILDVDEVRAWVAAHPDGRILTVERTRAPAGASVPEMVFPYRGAWLQLWRGEALLVARPELR